ncbi:MAG: ribosomal-processing cysteine protease Prp [Oscillospiraceae bacterium]
MIKCVFKVRDGKFLGFQVSGHEEDFEGEYGMNCSAVSSATMLACNTITDFLDAKARVTVADNRVTLILKKSNRAAQRMICAFYTHLEMLAQDTDQLVVKIIE